MDSSVHRTGKTDLRLDSLPPGRTAEKLLSD
jgi:hypothetical protein